MATLSRAVVRDFPQYYAWYGLREFTWNNITQHNRNGLLLRDPTVDGIKTGHTDTGRLLPHHLRQTRRHAPHLRPCSTRRPSKRARMRALLF